jgi:hypothetical protein
MQTEPKNSELEVLSIAYYVVGALSVLIAFTPLLYVIFGAAIYMGGLEMDEGPEAVPEVLGMIFALIGVVLFIVFQAFAIAVLITGRFIQKRTHYLYTFVMGCILCVFAPLGTILGVLTIVFLSKDSIKRDYGR